MRALLLCLALCGALAAHVGVNDVFFEGMAGVYPLYVTIRPPVVIPGVAEITIRSAAKDVNRIHIAPMTLTGPGSKFPPTPDVAVQSKDDPRTFHGSLWIMAAGSWQVRAIVDGRRGTGSVSIPVPAVSQRLSTMDPLTGGMLIVLVGLLAIGVVGIAGAAVREAQLPPGEPVDAAKGGSVKLAMAAGLLTAAAVTWLGWSWWDSESRAYERTIYKPLQMTATLTGEELDLRLALNGWFQNKSLDDFIPDHGHLMHLYAVREPKLDAVFHLHPKMVGPGQFRTHLPAMPAGSYRLFGDLVHTAGFPETLTARIDVKQDAKGPPANADDAGAVLREDGAIAGGGKVMLEGADGLRAGGPATLRFRVVDRDGNPAANLKPYLGMAAHLAVIKDDFTVFSHIHPSGNISMAAFEIARANDLRLNQNVVASSHVNGGSVDAVPSEFSFPFGFPSDGRYLLVLQFGTLDHVETTGFRIGVGK